MTPNGVKVGEAEGGCVNHVPQPGLILGSLRRESRVRIFSPASHLHLAHKSQGRREAVGVGSSATNAPYFRWWKQERGVGVDRGVSGGSTMMAIGAGLRLSRGVGGWGDLLGEVYGVFWTPMSLDLGLDGFWG